MAENVSFSFIIYYEEEEVTPPPSSVYLIVQVDALRKENTTRGVY